MLKEEPPGPIIMPARMVVSGVFLEPNTPSTSYLDFKCLDKFCRIRICRIICISISCSFFSNSYHTH